jgi:hypothetical protein
VFQPFVLVALMCSLGAGCKSAQQLEVQRLPLHVAILPMAEPTVGQASPGEHPGKQTGMRLQLDGEQVTGAVVAALEQHCFDRATLLELDEGVAGSAVDAFEREHALLALAREHGADLIIELGLRYDPEVFRKAASTFWLNYPLFLFAGPSNWFIPDNVYYADVELTTRVYDLHAIEAGGGELGDAVAEVISISSRFAGTELSFTERAKGISDYAKGIFIPSGHLARESERAAGEIRDAIVASLRTQVVQSFQSRRRDLVRAESIAPIFVEPDDVRLVRQGDHLRVQGRVLLRRDSLAQGVRAVHIDAGAERVTLEPTELSGEGATGYAIFPFDTPVPVAGEARYLRLECEAGSRDKYIRSYTFRIPPDQGGQP